MEGTAAVRTAALHRALGLSLFGAGVVAALVLFGGGSEARAETSIPLLDDVLGTVETVVDVVQVPVETVTNVVETVVVDVVAPVAVATDNLVHEVPIVGSVVSSTLGTTPVSDVVSVVSTTVTTTVDGVNGTLDGLTQTPHSGPGTPSTPVVPGHPIVVGPVLSAPAGAAAAPLSAGSDSLERSTDAEASLDLVTEPVTAAPAPAPLGTGGSPLAKIAAIPTGSSSSGSSASGGAASASHAADTTDDLSFALHVTGRESSRDDDLPPSPCSEFDTSPD